MIIAIFNKETLGFITSGEVSHIEDIAKEYGYMKIDEEDREYLLEIYKEKGKLKFRRLKKLNEQTLLSKLAFRKRMTLAERTAFDHVLETPAIPEEQKRILKTMIKDIELAESIDLEDEDLRKGLLLLEELKIINPGRTDTILSIND